MTESTLARSFALCLSLALMAACSFGDGDPGDDADAALDGSGGDATGADADDAGVDDAEEDVEDDADIDTATDAELEVNDADAGDGDDRDGATDATDATDADVQPDLDAADGSGDAADVSADGEGSGDADVDEDADADVEPETSEPCEGTASGEPRLELGTGLEMYVPLSDGDETVMAEGIQGGFHVWGGLRGSGFAPEDAEVEFRLTDADGASVGALVWLGDFSCDEATDQWVRYALTVFLDFEVWPPDVDGERWELCANATMGDGTELSDCVEIVVTCCDWLFGPPDE